MAIEFGKRRAEIFEASREAEKAGWTFGADAIEPLDKLDLVYRALCALMYNFVPKSGHPGGSISSGRIVQGLLFTSMDYDLSNPLREDADIISYAAGHKALGLYAIWALRDEIARVGDEDLLPSKLEHRLRIEDLLGFRKNPTNLGPLAEEFHAKALDGHPTPATPFVRLSTGASGVGVASSLGLAMAARDRYGDAAPRVHIVEGEGGLTPGRVAEALAAAGTMGLSNAIVHLDWNQASIDSNRVCRDADGAGEYVQWDPVELFYLHDWNVVTVSDGFDPKEVLAAQRLATTIDNGQPTAVVYRTVKGQGYGIEGRASHGAGHDLCSEPFYQALVPLTGEFECSLPKCDEKKTPCKAGSDSIAVEACYWDALQSTREVFAKDDALTSALVGRLRDARSRLDAAGREPREGAPDVEAIFDTSANDPAGVPEALRFEVGSKVALRGAFGKVLGHYNRASGGSILAASADLLGSTSINLANEGFADGFFHAKENPGSRLMSIGGICEDAMTGILSGIAAFGHHVPAGSSYGAFIASLGHIAARLHGIGSQARQEMEERPYPTWFLVCGHAGLKTGEDGPTHADPQPLQLLQENFPRGVMVTATPWEPQEMWPLITAALQARPAVVAPFLTRPAEPVLDRAAAGLAPAHACTTGVYELVTPDQERPVDATVVLQGSEVTYDFVQVALPKLRDEGLNVRAIYVASAELFDLQPRETRERIFSAALAQEAMGITGFTMPTLYRWVRSERGLEHSLHPYKDIGYPGSGHGASVLTQAGVDGHAQAEAIRRFARG
jgi:transketolase